MSEKTKEQKQKDAELHLKMAQALSEKQKFIIMLGAAATQPLLESGDVDYQHAFRRAAELGASLAISHCIQLSEEKKNEEEKPVAQEA